MKTVGVLALQGDFEAHRKAIERAGRARARSAHRGQLAQCDGLIIPGGESTTMLKLLEYEKLPDPVRKFGERKPIYGTCAGAILLAREVTHPAQASLDLMDIAVERNGYGRQIDSRIAKVPVERRRRVRSGFYPRADHPASRRRAQCHRELSTATRCGWSKAATW